MLARKKSSKQGKMIPLDWAESVARLLNESYKSECDKNGRYFDVYGQVYPEELLMIVSYLSEKDPHEAPIACFLSCDSEHISSEDKVKETQKNYIEITGMLFDEIFSSTEWSEFEPLWQEVTHKNQTYSYKITRENINLTLEANKLLGEEFLADQDEEDESEETQH